MFYKIVYGPVEISLPPYIQGQVKITRSMHPYYFITYTDPYISKLLQLLILSFWQLFSGIIHRQVNATCLSRVSTYDSRPLVSDASDRWRLNLFRFVCTPNKLAVVLPPGTRALLHLSTDSDRYTGTTIIRDQRTFRKLTVNPFSFLGAF